MLRELYIICFILLGSTFAFSQERLEPLHGNIQLIYNQSLNQNLNSNSLQKTMAGANDSLPYFEDFAYASYSPFPSAKKWVDSSVYINTGFAIAPPTIGVATFDGLDKNGYPYLMAAGPNVSGPADTLISKPLNLPAKKGGGFYLPSDSIAFSFLYQSAGFGDNPETNDSLILEFYKPLAATGLTTTPIGKWVSAWGTRGVSFPQPLDSTFKRAWIRIIDTAFFHDGFRFRFRNKATTSGSLDHWNVDFINIKSNYNKIDTISPEVAFAYVPRPFLKNYSAMPFKQFVPTEMGLKTSVFIRNNNYDPITPGNSIANVYYGYKIYDKTNTLVNTYTQNNCNVDFFDKYGYDKCPAHNNPVINYTFTPTDSCTYRIVHTFTTNPDYGTLNDTVIQYQNLSNYYAYDDGSAEAGYYLSTNGSKTALRYTLNVTDTLQAMDIFFDPVKEGNLIVNSSFRMIIWDDIGGQPGNIRYQDSAINPYYVKLGYNKIPRFKLTSPLILSPGTYYFGMKQSSNLGLNVGFDRNIDHKDALFYDVSGIWQQSGIPGSLMIHPIFGRPSYVIGINEQTSQSKINRLSIYPNPANDVLYIHDLSTETNSLLEIYSALGEKVKQLQLTQSTTEISTSDLANGLYFAILKTNSGSASQQKLIISR